ncbi:MAG: hypothetical protein RhofKO_01560 [Rhodothermales bacterium]
MDATHWDRIQQIFDDALSQPDAHVFAEAKATQETMPKTYTTAQRLLD